MLAKSAGRAKLRFDAKSRRRARRGGGRTRGAGPDSDGGGGAVRRNRQASGEQIGDLSAIRRDVGSLDVSVASTALVGLDAGVEQLIEYPYGCTEQLSEPTAALWCRCASWPRTSTSRSAEERGRRRRQDRRRYLGAPTWRRWLRHVAGLAGELALGQHLRALDAAPGQGAGRRRATHGPSSRQRATCVATWSRRARTSSGW